MNNPIQFGIIKKVNVDNRTVKIVCEQTSDIDKLVILNVIKVIKKNKKKFNYLEIGSFLGGSLTPFLSDQLIYYSIFFYLYKKFHKLLLKL